MEKEQLFYVIMANRDFFIVEAERYEVLKRTWTEQMKSGFASGGTVTLEGNTVMLKDIRAFYDHKGMEEYDMKMRGHRRCKWGKWHTKGYGCMCGSPVTRTSLKTLSRASQSAIAWVSQKHPKTRISYSWDSVQAWLKRDIVTYNYDKQGVYTIDYKEDYENHNRSAIMEAVYGGLKVTKKVYHYRFKTVDKNGRS